MGSLPRLYYLVMTPLLLAEDDTSISEPLSRALRRGGYEVDVTADPPGTLDPALCAGVDLLCILLREAGKVITREQIMREVWDAKWWTSTKTLDMHISWLRRKLGDDAHSPRYITTVRGVGFRFERGD